MQRIKHTAGVAIEHVFGLRVADIVDHLTRDLLQTDLGFRRYFAADNRKTGSDEGLAGDAR